ncbi:hypothetical protein HU200_027881 [Digitaria exilis]|uniref:F-box domain-containing protein n=1 Tax=Digitaria exilis TaxID=1010633 RepID=A0A835BW56_9POAL|nr:hypothetical protein HU200_027881 [Digitaria exilis]
MAHSGGELTAKSAKPSGEDRLSALPDDVLVLILLSLGTREAIRTSGISRRWRRVWALLPELRFHLAPGGAVIRGILEAPEEAAPLRWISVTTQGAGPESAAAWLPVAARRVSGELVYHNMPPAMNEHGDVDKDDDEPVGGGDLQLPCFEKATTIALNIDFLGLALPPQGIFARLTELCLRRVRFHSPSELGSVVSSPRCPCLKKLEVSNSRGLQNLSIHSESLLQLKLLDLHHLLHLAIVTPILQELGVGSCIRAHGPSEPVAIANISAPQLAESKFFPISMAQTGGEIAAKRPKPSDDGDGGAGEDRLSALPDDVLILILLRLDGVAAAARTSILSRRWRRVWTLLPELRFDLVPDDHRIREILDAPEAPELRSISITTEGAGPDSASGWLPVAARRLIGGLAYSNMVPGNDDEEEVEEGEAGARGEVQLPCFEKATVIVLDLGLLGLALPSAGVFARITKLYLSRVWFRGQCDLGNVVSSPRCPCLQRLKVSESRGMRNLSIHSESLLRIKLENLHLLRQLTIVAPKLLKLCMDFNFIDDDPSEPVANISAPQLLATSPPLRLPSHR